MVGFRYAFLVFFCLTLAYVHAQTTHHWPHAILAKRATIRVCWFPNYPFGYQEANGQIKGIEAEILYGFQRYVRKKYQIELTYQWVAKNTFKDVLDAIRQDTTGTLFGIAGFSFSDERRTFMNFSPSYMADMAVLVSTADIPIIRTQDELRQYLNNATALTAQGTILEKELIALREENKLNFKIAYTGGSDELVEVLRKRTNSFGFLNLPVYLMELDKGFNKLNRQNFLTKRYEGRGVGISKAGKWHVPMTEYFNSVDFKNNVENIIGSYINIDLYHFVENLKPENEVSLLNQEKVLQAVQLQLQELTIKQENATQNFLLIVILGVSIFLFIIGYQYQKQRQSNRLLKQQKVEIEAQANQIKAINDNLEELIQTRTKDLATKNKALEEYAFITAHKLRAPLASILGLVNLLERVTLPEDDKTLVIHLKDSAKKLDVIVHSVMNAIDATEDDNNSNQSSNN